MQIIISIEKLTFFVVVFTMCVFIFSAQTTYQVIKYRETKDIDNLLYSIVLGIMTILSLVGQQICFRL